MKKITLKMAMKISMINLNLAMIMNNKIQLNNFFLLNITGNTKFQLNLAMNVNNIKQNLAMNMNRIQLNI